MDDSSLPLEVGASRGVSVGPGLCTGSVCLREVVSAEWSASPAGIVRFEPGDSADSAIIVAEAEGEARIQAVVALRSGARATTTDFLNDTVVVIPAPTGGGSVILDPHPHVSR